MKNDISEVKNLLLGQDTKKIRAFLGNRNILIAFHVENKRKDLKSLKNLKKYLTSDSSRLSYKTNIEEIISLGNKDFILLNIKYNWSNDFDICRSKWDIYQKLMNGE